MFEEKKLKGMNLLRVFNECKLEDDLTIITYIAGERVMLASGTADNLLTVLGSRILRAYVISADKFRDGAYSVVIDLEKEGSYAWNIIRN